MQSLGMDGHQPSPISIQHNLTYVISEYTPSLEGSIANIGGRTLKDAALVTSSGWEILGDLGPGESKKISIPLSSPNNSASSNRYQFTSALGWDILPGEDIVKRRRSTFFNSVTTSYNDTLSANSGVYLMAWMDDEIPAPVNLQGEEPSATDTLFYIQKLAPTVDIKAGTLMLNSSLYGWESSLGNTLATSSYNLPSGGYSIDFRPSLPFQYSEVVSLRLNIGTGSAPQQVHPSIWNFQTKSWQALALESYGGVDIPEPRQYVGMDGEILISIQGDPSSYFDVTAVDFTMMVQP